MTDNYSDSSVESFGCAALGCLLPIYIVLGFFIGAKVNAGAGLIIFLVLTSLTFMMYFRIIEEENQMIRKRIKKRNDDIKRSGIHEIDQMSGIAFENYLAIMYREIGYKVTGTKTSGDFGVDLILSKNGYTYVVQVKRYSQRVGIRAVQEVASGVHYYDADYGWVVTNNYFTKSAIDLAAKSKVSLIDRGKLISEIINYKDGVKGE